MKSEMDNLTKASVRKKKGMLAYSAFDEAHDLVNPAIEKNRAGRHRRPERRIVAHTLRKPLSSSGFRPSMGFPSPLEAASDIDIACARYDTWFSGVSAWMAGMKERPIPVVIEVYDDRANSYRPGRR